MIYLTKVGTVTNYERTTMERASRPLDPNHKSGFGSLEIMEIGESLTVTLVPRSRRAMPDFWNMTGEAVSFLRKRWRLWSVDSPQSRGDDISLTIHLWRDFQ